MNERLYDTTGNSMMSGQSVMGFILGVVVGAGVALLFAPATGEDTRRRLGETAGRLRETAGRKLSAAKDSLNDIKRDAGQAVEAGRDAFQRSRSGSETRAGEPYPATGSRQS